MPFDLSPETTQEPVIRDEVDPLRLQLSHFRAWLRTQPFFGFYNFCEPEECVVTQFVRSVYPDTWMTHRGTVTLRDGRDFSVPHLSYFEHHIGLGLIDMYGFARIRAFFCASRCEKALDGMKG